MTAKQSGTASKKNKRNKIAVDATATPAVEPSVATEQAIILAHNEGLQLKPEQDGEAGLREAEQLLDRPPMPEHSAPKAGAKLSHDRAVLRSRFMSEETEPAVPEKGPAAA